mgnify:CR=1 FL=1
MTNLLPCPFCGSNNLRYEFCGSQGYIECSECCTQGPCDERAADPYCDTEAAQSAWNRRITLAQPEPQGPTLDDILELCADHEFMLGVDGANEEESAKGLLEIIHTALARWGRPAIKPVPVTERLPGPEDCDAQGRCWAHGPLDCPAWLLLPAKKVSAVRTHWLFHHALPVPQQENKQ